MFLTDQWGSNQAHIYLGTHKNHKVFIDQLGLRAFLIVWILNAWNIQVNWLGANFLNEISLKSMWFCTTEPYTSSFYSFYGDIFVFFLLIVMESSEGVLRLSYLNLKVYASWNMLQHLFFLFLFCGRREKLGGEKFLSATEIALEMGTEPAWWHQKQWKWNFLEFSHPRTSVQFYVLWVEICTHGDLQASVSFCCWSLKLLSLLERFVFTSLLLWQM